MLEMDETRCNDFDHKTSTAMTLQEDGDRKVYVGLVSIQEHDGGAKHSISRKKTTS